MGTGADYAPGYIGAINDQTYLLMDVGNFEMRDVSNEHEGGMAADG